MVYGLINKLFSLFKEIKMNAYILGGSRTAFGSFMGNLSTIPATKLGGHAIKGALKNSSVDPLHVEEVYMGQVIQAGVGQAPARQATLFSGLPENVPATTINKVCGSGLQSIILGSRTILSGENNLVIAGGMENMSLAPHLIPGSRQGFRYGSSEIKDSMQWDGLWDVYTNRAMGNCAEECVKKFGFKREEQDQFAMESFKRAQSAQKNRFFKNEISPFEITVKGQTIDVADDEGPLKANFEKMASLKPAFEKEGTITAANASTINDGACALVLGGEKYRSQAKFKIISFASHAQNPTWFTTAPVMAIKKSLDKAKLTIKDIDFFEINEAFAAVTMAAMKECEIPHEKVNIWGGAVALGHPIGASGARIVLTLMNILEAQKAKRGCAAICIGGGEALSFIIERI
jgi:acetyl-CoA C-acetyltransferase